MNLAGVDRVCDSPVKCLRGRVTGENRELRL